MGKKITIILVTLILFFSFTTGCIEQPEESDKIRVVATFYPLYEFSSRIGGEKVDVSTLIPAGVEPHDWEPGPRDIIKLESAQVFVYNGAGLEPFVEGMLERIEPGKLEVVDTSKGIELIKTLGEPDPHIWLDPILAKQQVENIEEALVKTDPRNSEYYRANANALKQELEELHEEITRELAPAGKRVFISSHTAFSYFAIRYNLEQIAITGLSPEIEPGPAEIVEIVKLARDHGVKYIFFEPLVSPRLSEVIAKEVGAQTLVLNPIEGLTEDEIKQGKNYFTLMRENLDNLKTALEVENG